MTGNAALMRDINRIHCCVSLLSTLEEMKQKMEHQEVGLSPGTDSERGVAHGGPGRGKRTQESAQTSDSADAKFYRLSRHIFFTYWCFARFHTKVFDSESFLLLPQW